MDFFSTLLWAIILYYFYYLYNFNRPEEKIKRHERTIEFFLNSIKDRREDDSGYAKILLMDEFYLRLKEKNKHDKEELLKIVSDWCNYLFNKNMIPGQTFLWLESQDEEERGLIEKEIKEHIFISEEIENRFAYLLGQEYINRLNKLREQENNKKGWE